MGMIASWVATSREEVCLLLPIALQIVGEAASRFFQIRSCLIQRQRHTPQECHQLRGCGIFGWPVCYQLPYLLCWRFWREQPGTAQKQQNPHLLFHWLQVYSSCERSQGLTARSKEERALPGWGQDVRGEFQIFQIIPDQQPPLVCSQPALDGLNDLMLVGSCTLRQLENLGDALHAGLYALDGLCFDPENGAILQRVAIGVFQCCLRFTDSSQPM